jgi:hypothetical protein
MELVPQLSLLFAMDVVPENADTGHLKTPENLFIISGNGGKPLLQSAKSGISERIPRLSEHVQTAVRAIGGGIPETMNRF